MADYLINSSGCGFKISPATLTILAFEPSATNAPEIFIHAFGVLSHHRLGGAQITFSEPAQGFSLTAIGIKQSIRSGEMKLLAFDAGTVSTDAFSVFANGFRSKHYLGAAKVTFTELPKSVSIAAKGIKQVLTVSNIVVHAFEPEKLGTTAYSIVAQPFKYSGRFNSASITQPKVDVQFLINATRAPKQIINVARMALFATYYEKITVNAKPFRFTHITYSASIRFATFPSIDISKVMLL